MAQKDKKMQYDYNVLFTLVGGDVHIKFYAHWNNSFWSQRSVGMKKSFLLLGRKMLNESFYYKTIDGRLASDLLSFNTLKML